MAAELEIFVSTAEIAETVERIKELLSVLTTNEIRRVTVAKVRSPLR